MSAQVKHSGAHDFLPELKNVTSAIPKLQVKSPKLLSDDGISKIMRPLKEDVYSLYQGDWFLESTMYTNTISKAEE